MKPSVAFEQQVHRIHELLDQSGAEVTWNDHVEDPDNPERKRQIDITVRREGRLTHIECRLRRAPQDVTWIEELMGRRQSLEADAIVAVSASGFTVGARAKARRHGVIVRDFHELTDAEVQDWGQSIRLTVYYY